MPIWVDLLWGPMAAWPRRARERAKILGMMTMRTTIFFLFDKDFSLNQKMEKSLEALEPAIRR